MLVLKPRYNIRPVQKSLTISPIPDETEEEGQSFSTCEKCNSKVRMREMRKHINSCKNADVDTLDDDLDILSTIMHTTKC